MSIFSSYLTCYYVNFVISKDFHKVFSIFHLLRIISSLKEEER